MSETYRSVGDVRFVCVVCFAHAATTDASCPSCGAPMLDGSAPGQGDEVLRGLRERAAKKAGHFDRWRIRLALIMAAALATIALVVLLATDLYRPTGTIAGTGVMWPWFPLFVVFLLPSGYLAPLFLRRPTAPAPDVERATVPELVTYLGLHIVDAARVE